MSRKKNTGRPSTVKPTLQVVPDDTSSYVPPTEAGKSLWAALLEHPNSSAAELAMSAGIGKSTVPKLLTQWLAEGRVTKTPGIARGGARVADRWAIGAQDAAPNSAPKSEATTEPASAQDVVTDSASTALCAESSVEPSVDVSEAASAGAPGPTGEPSADAVAADVPTTLATLETVPETGSVEPAPVAAGSKKTRLAKGGLHGLVEDFFHERPGETFGPSAISTKLQRSSGAVANACVRLVEKGILVRTQDSPKRYALSAQE